MSGVNDPIFEVDHLSLAYPRPGRVAAAPILADVSFTSSAVVRSRSWGRRDRANRAFCAVSTVSSSRRPGRSASTAPTSDRSTPASSGAGSPSSCRRRCCSREPCATTSASVPSMRPAISPRTGSAPTLAEVGLAAGSPRPGRGHALGRREAAGDDRPGAPPRPSGPPPRRADLGPRSAQRRCWWCETISRLRAARGLSIVAVTHQPDLVRRLGGGLLYLVKGHVQAFESIDGGRRRSRTRDSWRAGGSRPA